VMRIFEVQNKTIQTRHFVKPGEIVSATGYEWRENGVLYLEVITKQGLKQLIPQIELKAIFNAAEQNNFLTQNYYHASY
jgi:hypothetical protein